MKHDILVGSYIESLYLVDFSQYLDESLSKFVSNLNPPKTKQLLAKTYPLAASRDVAGFLDLVKKHGLDIKKMKPNNVIESLKTLPDDIQQGAQLCQRVLQNSISGSSKKSILVASYFVALVTKVKHSKSTNYMGSVKTELKGFVSKVQQFYEEAEEKATNISTSDLKDIAMAIGAVMTIATLVGVTLIVVLSLIPWLIGCAVTLLLVATAGFSLLMLFKFLDSM
jgi:hypothetical protein